MKSFQRIRNRESLWKRSTLLFLLAIATGSPAIQRALAATNVVIWDTILPFADSINTENRTAWKFVPSDLFTLETDPAKAASDPGYYGRSYSFKGDAVIENRTMTAVFWAAKGRVVIYTKGETAPPSGDLRGRRIVELLPLQTRTQPARISHYEILRNAYDEVALEISFAVKNATGLSAIVSIGKTEIVEVKPSENLKGISLLSSIEYGVVPGFVGDDLIFGAAGFPSAKSLCVPSENIFLGLIAGEDRELVMTWPKGKQQVKLNFGDNPQGNRLIESIDFDNDGQSFYLAALRAPGLWHREALDPSYLEKEVVIKWKRPFSAKWTTQLSEAGVPTAFTFRDSKAQIWRGVPGSYSYPVWFNGENAVYHLSKKVPPKGESVIYFLEGSDTPLSMSTPVDIMKATLGRAMSDSIVDVAGRKLRTHHRRSDQSVHRACTCGYTEAIQSVFEMGQEVAKKAYITEAVDDMIYFVQRHVERIDEYRRFADETIKFLRSQQSVSTELKEFTESLELIALQIPQEYEVQKENMKTRAYMDELARKTLTLASKKDANNLKAYLDLLKAWRAMGGAQDYVLAQCHAITRKLFQEAGYGCVNQPKAVELAQEIRRRCRQSLRNPDGYEIWPDY